MAYLLLFVFAQIDKIFENVVRRDEYLPTPMNIFFRYFTQVLLQSSHKSCEVSSGSNSKWPTYRHFCLLKLTKYFIILSVRINISQRQRIFFSDTLHMYLLQSSHKSCEVSSGSNSKWPTYRYLCLLKLTKYLKMLSVRMNISNTNEYLFLIIYRCIYYNPP